MMMDIDMYAVEDDGDELVASAVKPGVTTLGAITEFDYGDKKIRVIDPEYVTSLERRLIAQEMELRQLRDDVRQLKNSNIQRRREASVLQSQLDRKIDRS
jgi:hypothetical protein